MLKYTNSGVVFREFPDETALIFNISGCKIHCHACHSKWLWEDIGEPLTIDAIRKEVKPIYDGISCIGLMGGDKDEIDYLAAQIRREFPSIKIGWYTGGEEMPNHLENFDYVKVGPYIKENGGLDKKTTNQHMYRIIYIDNHPVVRDITNKFWK